jgi:hypothetical protein
MYRATICFHDTGTTDRQTDRKPRYGTKNATSISSGPPRGPAFILREKTAFTFFRKHLQGLVLAVSQQHPVEVKSLPTTGEYSQRLALGRNIVGGDDESEGKDRLIVNPSRHSRLVSPWNSAHLNCCFPSATGEAVILSGGATSYGIGDTPHRVEGSRIGTVWRARGVVTCLCSKPANGGRHNAATETRRSSGRAAWS